MLKLRKCLCECTRQNLKDLSIVSGLFFVCVWNNIKKMFHVKQILGINDVMVAVACFDVIDGGAYESKYGDCGAVAVV